MTGPIELQEAEEPEPGVFIRRPLAGMALFFILGTALGLRFPVPAAPLMAAAAALLVMASLFIRISSFSTALFAVIFLLGWLNSGMTVKNPSGRELAALMERPNEFIRVIGVVDDDPQEKVGRRENELIRSFQLALEGVERAGGWEKAQGHVAIRWKTQASVRRPEYGERWLLTGLMLVGAEGGRLDRPVESYSMRLDGDMGRFLSSGHGVPLFAWCLRARKVCYQTLGRGIEGFPREVGLLRALMLGYRQEMSPELYRAFSTTGTLHVVAISGMHVAILGLLFIFLLKGLGLPRPRWILFLAPALILYTIGTGMSASAVRACVMAIIFWAAPIFQRRPDGPSALAMAAALILMVDPWQIDERGFQLSFVAVAGLMALYPVFMKPLRRFCSRDPWQLQDEEPGWRSRWRHQVMAAGSLMASSLAAWVVTTPITAASFNLISPVAFLGNLLVIPLSFVVLLTGVLSLVIGSFSIVAAEIFNHANRIFISWMLGWVELTARVPGGFFAVQSPPWTWLAGWYLAIVLWISARGRARAGVLVALLIAIGCGWAAAIRDDRVQIDILDVGQGNAAFINVPGSKDVLFDTGPGFRVNELIRYLRRQGVDGLEALALSHGDTDHIGGAVDILRAIPVRELWCGPFMGRSSYGHEIFSEARRQDVLVRRMVQGDRVPLSGGVEWEVLHPSGDVMGKRGDPDSLVVRVTRGSASMLFMSDAEESAEQNILQQRIDPVADVLVVGSHGVSNAGSRVWIDAVHPKWAVISVGAENADGCPDRERLRQWAGGGIQIWRTDEQGSARIRLDGSGSAVDVRAAPAGFNW